MKKRYEDDIANQGSAMSVDCPEVELISERKVWPESKKPNGEQLTVGVHGFVPQLAPARLATNDFLLTPYVGQ